MGMFTALRLRFCLNLSIRVRVRYSNLKWGLAERVSSPEHIRSPLLPQEAARCPQCLSYLPT